MSNPVSFPLLILIRKCSVFLYSFLNLLFTHIVSPFYSLIFLKRLNSLFLDFLGLPGTVRDLRIVDRVKVLVRNIDSASHATRTSKVGIIIMLNFVTTSYIDIV